MGGYYNACHTQYLAISSSGPSSLQPSMCCRCCTFDNRGIGSSTIPEHLSAYKTGIMAADVRALMDHLGWQQAHVMGMSLGGALSSPRSAAVKRGLAVSDPAPLVLRAHEACRCK